MNKQKLLIACFSIIAMICTFLPWIEEYGQLYYGRQMEGWISLVLFGTTLVICLGGNIKEPLEKKFKLGIYGTSGLATIIGLTKIIKGSPSIVKMIPDVFGLSFTYSWQIQPGLYLMVALGALIIFLSAFFNFTKEKDA